MVTNTGIGVGIGIPFRNNAHGGDKPYLPPEIKDSLKAIVIAYGKSNDDADRSIVKNLVDASNPFIISNAAFKLNSGFGEYEQDFTDWKKSPKVTSFDSESIKFTSDVSWVLLYHPSSIGEDIPSFKVRVKLYGKGTLYYSYITQEGKYINVAVKSEIFETPICYNTKYTGEKGVNVGFTLGVTSGECSGTITQIPSFEGAFVTDGIDDLITSTKTVQEMLGGSNEITVVSMIHQIGLGCRTNFICDKGSYWRCNEVANTGEGKTGIYGYSSTNISVNTPNIINNVLGDKVDYSVTGDRNDLTPSQFSVVGYISSSGKISYTSSVAWYWTIIANKVLTTDEINQVIAYYNLDRTLKPDILCNTIKQGITNENHAEFGDKLIDFSGNGRDIQLNNIAWKWDSGIGKYVEDFTTWYGATGVLQTFSKIEVTDGFKHNWVINRRSGESAINSFKVLIKGIPENGYIRYRYFESEDATKKSSIDIYEDGEYSLPNSTLNNLNDLVGFQLFIKIPPLDSQSFIGLTITQIPSHAGALCLDGVNDFGKVTGMPIYKDYTVIADYIRISAKENVQDAPILSKSKVIGSGAFLFNYLNADSVTSSFSFGTHNTLKEINDFERKIYYLSKYASDGYNVNAGSAVDYDTMWLGTYRDNVQNYFTGAIYSLMTFPYSMSEFLIERQLKKHKLGTLYPNMVEFRPVIKANANYKITYYQIDSTNTWKSIKVGDYIVIGAKLAFQITFDNDASELKEVVSPQLSGIIVEKRPSNPGYNIYSYITSKSPQKINITIDEYIRFEDIVQPYPAFYEFNDENRNLVTWGSKIKVGSTITRIKAFADSNLLKDLYNISYPKLNGVASAGSKYVVERQMVFTCTATWAFDNNEPKCILSPRLLSIPNSSYKILGYIPDISGNGNNGVIHNSAYAEGSGVNEDGSYQFDGVDDFVAIPTTVGGKQVLMKVNWQKEDTMIYNQNPEEDNFAIYANDYNNNNLVNAYASRNNGSTYIDGILNNNILATQLKDVTHNITITNENVIDNTIIPVIGANAAHNNFYAQMSLYDFMLFDEISTDDKIKELNEYVGIEAKVELPPYYWDTYGKTNLDEDKATIQQRGVAEGDYDITNYNHAYDKMSGYGGYNLGRFDKSWASSSSSNTSIKVVQRNPYDITLKKLGGNSDWEFNNAELKVISNPVSVKFKSNKNIRVTCDYHYYPVGGNSEGTPLGITSKDLIANKDAIITISPISQENIDKYNIDVNRGYYLIYFQLSSTLAVNEEVTIEMLPLYPNALLYDGVTDYSENANIPALTDFTYVFKRKLLDNVAGCASMTKGLTDQQRAVVIDYINTTGGINGTSFGNMAFVPSLRDSDIIYSTTTNINGTTITKGNNPDSNGIDIGKFATYYKKMVFYKLILYPKTIPLLQINFLKNLMERDEIIDLDNSIFKK